MSIIDAIRVELTGRKSYLKEDFDITFDSRPTRDHHPTLNEYKIGVEWGFSTTCKERHLPAMIKNCSRMFKDAIYGDFKDRLLKLERLVYEGKREESIKEIVSILSEIYD